MGQKISTVIEENPNTRVKSAPLYSVEVFVEGMGMCLAPDDAPIYLEFVEGKWWLRVWSDINKEDETHRIDMSGALESNRGVSNGE